MSVLEDPNIVHELQDVKSRICENIQMHVSLTSNSGDGTEYSDPSIEDVGDTGLEQRAPHSLLDPLSDAILCGALREQDELALSLIHAQSSVLPTHREAIVQWLIQLNHRLGFSPDAVHNAVMFFDLVSMRNPIPESEIHSYAAVCYFLAVKIDENTRPDIETINSLTGQSFSNAQCLRKEVTILQTLDFKLCYPTIRFYIRVFLEGLAPDANVTTLATFLADVGLIKCGLQAFRQSTVALAALILSFVAFGLRDLALNAIKISHCEDLDSVVQCMELLKVECETIVESHPAAQAVRAQLSAIVASSHDIKC
jgi:hypothetical protein